MASKCTITSVAPGRPTWLALAFCCAIVGSSVRAQQPQLPAWRSSQSEAEWQAAVRATIREHHPAFASGSAPPLAQPSAHSYQHQAHAGQTHASQPRAGLTHQPISESDLIARIPADARAILPAGCTQQWPNNIQGPNKPLPNAWVPPAPGVTSAAINAAANEEDPHRAVFLESKYPSAMTCAKCHPRHFEDWRVSAHAYAYISPMFQRFEQKLTDLSMGTVGSFCARCHGPIATQEGIPRYSSLLDAPPIVREGITCVSCHRVVESYGKTHGHCRIETGDIHQPVIGGGTGVGLAEALRNRESLKLKTDPTDKGPGQPIHSGFIHFETISRSDFCLTCHQVAVHPGIWLEVVYAQYNAGPAKAKGITCQQCHMGAIPGKPDGYEEAHIAELGGKPYGQPRKYSNHMFWGPGYSIAHPGLFPIDEKGERYSPREWLDFDWQAGWGTKAFEDAVYDARLEHQFPPPWDNSDDRRDARRILDKRLASLSRARAGSIAAMEAGADIEGPFITRQPRAGKPLRFHYVVHNRSEGHNMPTGSLGAQPQMWLNVALVNPRGQTVWESGYLDTQGDLADMHSEDVARGLVPRDSQLFNLQTKFLITNVKGTDREVALPVNVDVDPIPFLRPPPQPISVLNHPPLIRMEAHSIPPLDHRRAGYRIPADRLSMPGVYRLDVRLRSRVEPSYFMRFVGSTPEMINRMNHQTLSIHPQSFTFVVQ